MSLLRQSSRNALRSEHARRMVSFRITRSSLQRFYDEAWARAMQNPSAIRQQLFRIRSRLLEMPVFSSGRPTDDDKADEQTSQLDVVQQQLEVILRDLKSDAHFAQLLVKGARNAPLEHRWAARESAEQKSRNVGLLIAETEALAALVRDLLQRNGLLTPTQVGKDVIDLIEEFQKHLSHTKTGTQQHTDQPAYGPANPGELHLEAVGPLITFLIVAVRYWKQQRSRKAD